MWYNEVMVDSKPKFFQKHPLLKDLLSLAVFVFVWFWVRLFFECVCVSVL